MIRRCAGVSKVIYERATTWYLGEKGSGGYDQLTMIRGDQIQTFVVVVSWQTLVVLLFDWTLSIFPVWREVIVIGPPRILISRSRYEFQVVSSSFYRSCRGRLWRVGCRC